MSETNGSTTAQLIFLEEEEHRLLRAHSECDEPVARRELWDHLEDVRTDLAKVRARIKEEDSQLQLTPEERALLKVAVGHLMGALDGRTVLAQDLAALAKKLGGGR
jgi:hypothetical protein